MLKHILITLLCFLLIDGAWLALIAREFYAKHLGFLMAKTFNLSAAGIFYAIYAVGVVFLVISPSLQSGSVWSAVGRGALLGLCAYAAYDLTNMATIKNWPMIVTVVDIAWGTFMTALVAGISYAIITRWL